MLIRQMPSYSLQIVQIVIMFSVLGHLERAVSAQENKNFKFLSAHLIRIPKRQ